MRSYGFKTLLHMVFEVKNKLWINVHPNIWHDSLND